MNTGTGNETSEAGRHFWLWALVLSVPGWAFMLNFLSDPLCLYPVLDGRENWIWAQRIAEGTVPAEPMYRALLYLWFLSHFVAVGAAFPQFAAALGISCHILNAFLVSILARQVWGGGSASRSSQECRSAIFGQLPIFLRPNSIAGVLYLLYPVAQYFAVQIFDITLGISFFLGGLVYVFAGFRATGKRRKFICWSAGGILLGLAVAVRPNFLPAVLVFPLCVLVHIEHGSAVVWKRLRIRPSVGFCVGAGLAVVLLLQGMINMRMSGEFRVLPWQGTYNLVSANRDGANGKFLTQQVAFEQIPEGQNPTRLESEYLYAKQTGATPPYDVAAMKGHWSRVLREDFLARPTAYVMLLGKKVLYLLNDWEQYNNLSYEYQKERFVVLKWNPLGWGILGCLALSGLIVGWRCHSHESSWTLLFVGLAYTAGLLLFFVSARFRLPLVPLLCVAAGGLAFCSMGRLKKVGIPLLIGLGLWSVLSFGNWANAQSDKSFVQDELLLAIASANLGDDHAVLRYAEAGLEREPERQDLLRLVISARYNLQISSTQKKEGWQILKKNLSELDTLDPISKFIFAVSLWHDGDLSTARAIWRNVASPDSQAALNASEQIEAPEMLSPEDRLELLIHRMNQSKMKEGLKHE